MTSATLTFGETFASQDAFSLTLNGVTLSIVLSSAMDADDAAAYVAQEIADSAPFVAMVAVGPTNSTTLTLFGAVVTIESGNDFALTNVTTTSTTGSIALFTPPVIQPRFFRWDDDQPKPHTSPRNIMSLLRGVDLTQFQDPDGTLTGFNADLLTFTIPEVTSRIVKALRYPMDYCRMIEFVDGPGSDTITLPFKNIQYVNALFVRILPSLPWYRFTHFRNVDGTEFNRSGFIEAPQNPAYKVGNSNLLPVTTPPFYTGIEDADILVDTRGRNIVIPPRALILGAGLPLSNYSFIVGKMNVEVHYVFGFPPTAYLSGAPLQFVPQTGALIDPNPNPPTGFSGVDNVDWSSGMPAGLTRAAARLAVNQILRQNWRGVSFGLSSTSMEPRNRTAPARTVATSIKTTMRSSKASSHSTAFRWSYDGICRARAE
jgi:hypothetical protein